MYRYITCNAKWLCAAVFLAASSTGSLKSVGPKPDNSNLETQPKIEVDAGKITGKITAYMFGQNLEHEHGTISGGEQNMNHEHGLHSGGLWAEMLRDRKFEEGDQDEDGVANGWVPEERITNRYWELQYGRGPNVRYYLDHRDFYGGGTAQGIELYGSGSNHASIYQVHLQFSKGKRYAFYVYLKRRGKGAAWVEFSSVAGGMYSRSEFPNLSEGWHKYVADFTAPEDTDQGRVRIGAQGDGTFWIDSASLMPADNTDGMRTDVLAALKPLGVPLLRYPGGCFADTYHWKDGIGARDRRPERWSPMWNEWEPNDFGTDEFMELARKLGFDVQITANYLSGTPQEAEEWAQYTNGSVSSPMGRLRAANGHPEPYAIRIWAVGNEAQELCSQDYFKATDINDYTKRFSEFKVAIEKADPSIRMMAAGAPGGPLQWNRELFEMTRFDFLAASIYTGEGEGIDDYDTKIMDLTHFYRHVVAEPLDFANRLLQVIRSAGDQLPADHPSIAVTEFNSWWLTEKVDPDFRLCNALYIAGVYHALMKQAKYVAIAELESLVDVQGIVEVNQSAVKLTPEYFAYLLYRHHTGNLVLNTQTESPKVTFDSQLPALDAQGTMSADHLTLDVAVINREESEDITARISISGWTARPGTAAHVLELNGNSRDAANSFGKSEDVNIRTRSMRTDQVPFAYCFPAHSVTIIELAAGR